MNETEKKDEVSHEIKCYEMGRKFGRVATQIMFNLPFNVEEDTLMSIECRNSEETKRGIKDGIKEIYDSLENLDKLMISKSTKEKE